METGQSYPESEALVGTHLPENVKRNSGDIGDGQLKKLKREKFPTSKA